MGSRTAAQELAALGRPDAWQGLAGALGDWVPAQRWFQGKARVVTGLRVVEAVLLAGGPGEPGVLDVVVEVAYAGGPPERYQVPLVAAAGEDRAVAARAGGLVLRDALADDEACRALARLALSDSVHATATGARLRGLPVAPASTPGTGPVHRLGVEQSNSSAVVGDAMLKLFRKLEDGLNPEVELTRALTEAGFEHVPAQHGAVVLEHGPAQHGAVVPDLAAGQTALAVLSAFAAGAREGWAVARQHARTVAAGGSVGTFAAAAGDLGAVVGRMHAALREAFGAQPPQPGTAAGWSEQMRAQMHDVLALAGSRAPGPCAPVLEAAGEIERRLASVAGLAVPGPLVRIHGDLHLAQVLVEDGRWLVLDFEGEPARPLAERRRPQSPLRDVAGMLRSFDYAAAHADPAMPARLAAWRDGLRRAFVDSYLATAEPAGLLPGSAAARTLLDAFELDKAVYELGYELGHRPDWIGIPVGGILRVVERRD